MPIRADEADRYPDDWPAISHQAKERAGWRCECTGECGGVEPHLDDDDRCRNEHGAPRWRGAPGQCVVRLTTAHLDHTPENCADDNLRVFCEGCHLRYDQAHHRATRERNRLAALGMDPLFELDELAPA